MSVELLVVGNVANCQHIEPCISPSTSSIDGKQDWISQEASDKANVSNDFKIAKEEEAINGSMVENECIGYAKEWNDPIEPA